MMFWGGSVAPKTRGWAINPSSFACVFWEGDASPHLGTPPSLRDPPPPYRVGPPQPHRAPKNQQGHAHKYLVMSSTRLKKHRGGGKRDPKDAWSRDPPPYRDIRPLYRDIRPLYRNIRPRITISTPILRYPPPYHDICPRIAISAPHIAISAPISRYPPPYCDIHPHIAISAPVLRYPPPYRDIRPRIATSGLRGWCRRVCGGVGGC